MTREEKIKKLKNGSDTAIWAANEIEILDLLLNANDAPVAYVKGCSVGWIQPQAGQLKDRQPLYAKIIKINEVDNQKLFKSLEFAEYMAKKAEQYIEEYNLLEEERLHQAFHGKKDNEKLFQMEQELGEIATQLKIYIYEFRKRLGAANMLNLQKTIYQI
jgi:hypothetical protein